MYNTIYFLGYCCFIEIEHWNKRKAKSFEDLFRYQIALPRLGFPLLCVRKWPIGKKLVSLYFEQLSQSEGINVCAWSVSRLDCSIQTVEIFTIPFWCRARFAGNKRRCSQSHTTHTINKLDSNFLWIVWLVQYFNYISTFFEGCSCQLYVIMQRLEIWYQNAASALKIACKNANVTALMHLQMEYQYEFPNELVRPLHIFAYTISNSMEAHVFRRLKITNEINRS